MKITVTFKDPDVVDDAVKEAVSASVAKLGLSEEEAEAVEELRRSAVRDVIGEWVSYGEYVTVEFDSDAKTAVVVRCDG